jgi:hypothetical protein
MFKFIAAFAMIIASIAIGACGADTKTKTVTKSASPPVTVKTATTPPEVEPETFSAYDDEILSEAEKSIVKRMHEVARDNPGQEVGKTFAHCIADSERNFTCESQITLRFADEGDLCSDFNTTQRGNVDPDTGDWTWKNTKSDSGDPYDCDAEGEAV